MARRLKPAHPGKVLRDEFMEPRGLSARALANALRVPAMRVNRLIRSDVWFPQPAPRDHPWRTMPFEAMTPHISGSSLSAQARYAAGVREILECWFENRPIRDEYLIVAGGVLAGAGAHSYSAGDATRAAEEAARFREIPRGEPS